MKLAEEIRARMPSCERVRLMNSGTEATSTAVRSHAASPVATGS
jgi:glutamate-1-semialdehyde 2,1-aminomutase